jgi:hypothetical protein
MRYFNFELRVGKLIVFVSLCFILSIAFSCAGCGSQGPTQHAISKNLSSIKSVCLLELDNKTIYPKISEDVTDSLYQSLQKKQRFNLSQLRQTDDMWKTVEVKSDSLYTLEQLMAAHKLLGSDALLMGTVTSYSPYPRMSIGLRLKLVDLRTGQTVWAIEQLWDTTDKSTEERLKKYFDQQLRSSYSPIGEQLANLSTINFVKFVTYEIMESM